MTATAFSDGGIKNPRHKIVYASQDKWASRTVRHDPNGRPEIVMEGEDVITIRIDLSQILDTGENIVTAQDDARHCVSAITYNGPYIYLTVSNPTCDGAYVLLEIRTTSNEQMTQRIGVRLPRKRGEERSVQTKAYGRGSVG